MEDLRQRRTKKHLMNALVELMEERSFQELSVVDICERAMVHRTTFYAHFEDTGRYPPTIPASRKSITSPSTSCPWRPWPGVPS